MADLRVEDAVFNLGFLHRIGRRGKVEVGGARETFRRIVGDAIQRQPVVPLNAERSNLHRDAAVGIVYWLEWPSKKPPEAVSTTPGVRVAYT